ncbi:MAG: hypothetical protein ILO34_08485, partial [Kiritimatiellae bacterium]|nr:hypothetical protein [Kiritimatiellia bacterium]
MLGLLSALMSAEGRPRDGVAALKHDGRHGRVSMSAGGKRFPGGAKVSFGRTRSEAVERRVCGALAKMGAGNGASRVPRVLAMYDVSVSADGRKWQPEAGEPVRVEVELSEPVPVGSGSSLSVVHLADNGEIEELPPSRFGFVRSDDGATVVAFWFSASGFSIYSIVDMNGDLATPRRFYHFYDHPSAIEGSHAVRTFPYRYADRSNDVVNVQIVKDGDMLKEPPVPEDILDENGVPVSTFEGWYVVHNEPRPANAVESKLDSAVEPFTFVWPVGVTERHLAFTNGVSVTENADTDYYVVPLYEHARYLQFNEKERDEQGTGDRIIDRKIIALNDETGIARIKVSDVSAALKNSRQEYFCGWSYLDKNGQYTDLMLYSNAGTPQEEYINIDDALFQVNGGNAIQLWPLYVSAHFLNFDTNAKGSGATYVGSLFVRSTTDIGAVAPSGNRLGYDFAGWCTGTVEGGKVRLGERVTDANGRVIPNVTATNATGEVILYTDASGNIRLNKDVTLYASWTANTSASYRVIVWQQRVTDSKNAADADKKYFYVTHYTSPEVSASTAIADSLFKNFTGTRADGTSFGSATNLATLSGPAAANAANEDFTGFHYARWACEDATVASDGTTVINVYYDRDLITLRFSLYDSNQTETTYSMSTATSGTLYGTDDGENYFEVYYDNGQWYKTRTSVPGYSYSTEHTGDRYVKSGNSYTKTSSNSPEEQYRKVTTWLVITNYEQIFYNEADGKWYQSRTEATIYAYSDPYSGNRYTVSTSNWIVNQTMTGLYGQTLAANGYVWPSGRRWYDG